MDLARTQRTFAGANLLRLVTDLLWGSYGETGVIDFGLIAGVVCNTYRLLPLVYSGVEVDKKLPSTLGRQRQFVASRRRLRRQINKL